MKIHSCSNLILSLVLMPTLLANQVNAEGDVTVQVAGNGKIKLRGEDNTNQVIWLFPQQSGQVMLVDLLGSTTFNGQSTLLVGPIVDDVQIDLRSGNKSLIFAANQSGIGVMIPGDLAVTSNSNSNQTTQVHLELVLVGGKTTIKLKNGDDIVTFSGGQFGDRVRVDTGSGEDQIALADHFGDSLPPSAAELFFHGDLQVNTGKGNDICSLNGPRVDGKARLKMGSENDCVFVVVSILAELEVNGNSGRDSFWQVNNIFNSPPVLKSIENADHN